MTSRPIIFSAPMVRAILEGRKTQTRRPLRDQAPIDLGASEHGAHLSRRPVHDHGKLVGHRLAPVRPPYGLPGDRLWVRESCWIDKAPPGGSPYRRAFFEGGLVLTDGGTRGTAPGDPATYTAEMFEMNLGLRKTPSIHMPRWASRITLEVTGVRVERLQEITDADARAEGVEAVHPVHGEPLVFRDYGPLASRDPCEWFGSARDSFETLWDSINAKRAPWASNPLVWVVEFRRVK